MRIIDTQQLHNKLKDLVPSIQFSNAPSELENGNIQFKFLGNLTVIKRFKKLGIPVDCIDDLRCTVTISREELNKQYLLHGNHVDYESRCFV